MWKNYALYRIWINLQGKNSVKSIWKKAMTSLHPVAANNVKLNLCQCTYWNLRHTKKKNNPSRRQASILDMLKTTIFEVFYLIQITYMVWSHPYVEYSMLFFREVLVMRVLIIFSFLCILLVGCNVFCVFSS
jgi:hypothetical protein